MRIIDAGLCWQDLKVSNEVEEGGVERLMGEMICNTGPPAYAECELV